MRYSDSIPIIVLVSTLLIFHSCQGISELKPEVLANKKISYNDFEGCWDAYRTGWGKDYHVILQLQSDSTFQEYLIYEGEQKNKGIWEIYYKNDTLFLSLTYEVEKENVYHNKIINFTSDSFKMTYLGYEEYFQFTRTLDNSGNKVYNNPIFKLAPYKDERIGINEDDESVRDSESVIDNNSMNEKEVFIIEQPKIKTQCYKCNGTGEKICTKCYSKGVLKCADCNGTGVWAYTGKTCNQCGGNGMKSCNGCGGDGHTSMCNECSGKGYIIQ